MTGGELQGSEHTHHVDVKEIHNEAEEEMDSKMSHAYFDAIEHIDVIDDGENHPHLIFSNKKNSKRKDEKEHHDVRVRIT
ncbi:MAG: hypothetical protein HN411_04770 [Waddliaceae bacterium]|jgi:hypothetical protein|nr:hypothetical protein [Waddliaceae bacterium]MBT3579266.1 hypothetical protein [Waddliaceae bacterium]MBT4444589.1 hypothetical protein [Waddliaceae bacterium]MBT6928465.1 hypothetical protein [Waddliaceae bacterium]MBT7264111.1 hypothetical protein [Waddliaceae bacterium]